jgi:hypothetical protein
MAAHHGTQLRDHDVALMTNTASQLSAQSLRSLAIVEVVHRDVDASIAARGPSHPRRPEFSQASDRLRRSPHSLVQPDLAVGDGHQRLHRQC